MKYFTSTLFVLLMTIMASAQQILPSEKVKAAFSAEELALLNEDKINELNIKADHLCWFETVKSENTDAVYTITDKSGNAVTLSESDLQNFNPLLYNLPQDDFVCGNLIIETSEGQRHLLVIRSVSMMDVYVARVKKQQSKSRK